MSASSRGNDVAAVGDDLLRLGERDARERQRRHLELDAEQLGDLGAVLLLHRGEAGDEQLFVHLHDVFVRVDPAHLGVDRGELGGVARGERRVGAERRPDLEHLAEAGGLRHLLEELRALREVRGALEVADLEELGPRLATPTP